LAQKTIVITGAFGALGRATIAAAQARNWKVAAVDITRAPADASIISMGEVDLADPEQSASAIQSIANRVGRIDGLLNLAGGFAWNELESADSAVWDRMYKMNLRTAANACRAGAPYLIESRGAIVNVGAGSALQARAGFGPYAAAKSGVHKLTESLSQELKGRVRVNAVLPSIIDTLQNRSDMPDANYAFWVKPIELANVMLFLASDEASAVTGALVPVSGRV
jgi:NAD(P)-dependent dehydrogenase (short-subunit alcohol dehydrogenase family)